jgi:hypothetical protein
MPAKRNVGGIAMARHREQLIPAPRITAAANLALLRILAASKRRNLTNNQSAAAIRMADHLERVVNDHARRRTNP